MLEEEPNSSLIHKWKTTYGAVFVITLPDGRDCYFRPLTVGEYKKLTSEESISVEAEELAIELAVLYPKLDLDHFPAGIASAIAEDIFANSQFTSPKDAKNYLLEQRAEMDTVAESMKAFVLAAIPSYKPEDLDSLTFFELTARVALAENVIKVQQASFGLEENTLQFEIVDVEEERRKEEEKERRRRQFEKERVERFVKEGGVQANPETPIITPTIQPDDPIAAKLFGAK